MVLKINKNIRIKAIEIFKHKKRICVVLQLSFFENTLREFLEGPILSKEDYCTGYVEVLHKNYGKSYMDFLDKIKTEELTYSGDLGGLFDGVWFFGFDTAHSYNDMYPETKTFEYVKKRTIELCEEMIKKKI